MTNFFKNTERLVKMKALNYDIRDNYLAFAKVADPVLHIKNKEHYHTALRMIESLLTEAKDNENDPLNGLIDAISHAVETYECKKPEFKSFNKKLSQQKQDISVLRLLMDQHNLGVADFPEIGDKSLISKILSGKRNLTKSHIKKLSERFSIDPGLFF